MGRGTSLGWGGAWRCLAALCVLFGLLASPAVAQQATLPGAGGVTVLIPENRPPFAMRTDAGEDIGFDVDLANALCDAAGFSCQVVCLPWETILERVRRGQGDLVIGGVGEDWDRMEAWFTGEVPYYRSPNRFAAPPGTVLEPNNKMELEGLHIGVVAYTAQADRLFIRHGRRAQISEYPSSIALRDALSRGEVDIIHDDGLVLWHFVAQDMAQEVNLTGIDDRKPQQRRILTGIDQYGLVEPVARALEGLKRTGRYREISSSYFPFSIY
ncbi:MAG: substrate-binding periplasmic protein [Rhodospirillaceae bacterium]